MDQFCLDFPWWYEKIIVILHKNKITLKMRPNNSLFELNAKNNWFK